MVSGEEVEADCISQRQVVQVCFRWLELREGDEVRGSGVEGEPCDPACNRVVGGA